MPEPQRDDETQKEPDFGVEHAQPAALPVTPPVGAADGPLEGFDPDRDGWGRKGVSPPLWERLRALFTGLLR